MIFEGGWTNAREGEGKEECVDSVVFVVVLSLVFVFSLLFSLLVLSILFVSIPSPLDWTCESGCEDL